MDTFSRMYWSPHQITTSRPNSWALSTRRPTSGERYLKAPCPHAGSPHFLPLPTRQMSFVRVWTYLSCVSQIVSRALQDGHCSCGAAVVEARSIPHSGTRPYLEAAEMSSHLPPGVTRHDV